jgi:hypothetical protein
MGIQAAWKVLWITPFLFCAERGAAEPAAPTAGGVGFRPTRAERVLPQGTVAFLSVPDCPAAIKKWGQAGFRPVWGNPALRALFVELEALLPKGWRGQQGFAWKELLELPSGEACLALARSPVGPPAAVIILACRGRQQAAAGFFERLGAVESRDAGPTKIAVPGAEIVRYQSLSYFIKDDLLVATSQPPLTEQLARTWVAGGGVIGAEAWQAVLEQAEMNKEAADPDIRWFIRPRELVDAFAKAKDSPVVTHLGLDLVRSAGGGCWLAHGGQAAIFRIGVFVPELGEGGRRPLLLAQTGSHDPPQWVPATAAGYASARCDLKRSVAAFGDLVDCVLGEPGIFRETLKGLKEDPNGPRVDLDAELYQKLRSRVMILWGPEQPGQSAWASCGFAFEVGDERGVAGAVGRLYGGQDAKKRQMDGATFYYEDVNREDNEQAAQLLHPPGKSKMPPQPHQELIAFVGVPQQCVLSGNGKELLASLAAPKTSLAADGDYRRVAAALDRLAAGPVSGRSFSRAGDDFRLVEQIATPLRIVLLLAGPVTTNDSTGWITPAAGTLPPPAACPSHCGPGGWVAQPTPKGCRVVGCVLSGGTPGKPD